MFVIVASHLKKALSGIATVAALASLKRFVTAPLLAIPVAKATLQSLTISRILVKLSARSAQTGNVLAATMTFLPKRLWERELFTYARVNSVGYRATRTAHNRPENKYISVGIASYSAFSKLYVDAVNADLELKHEKVLKGDV